MTQVKELIAKMLFAFAATISVAAVLVICIFIFGNGIPAIAEIGFSNFLFGTTWQPSSDIYGIGVMVLGSFYVMAGALVIGVPWAFCALFSLLVLGVTVCRVLPKMASSSWQAFRRLCTAFSVWLCSFHSLEAISGVQANRFYVLRLCLA